MCLLAILVDLEVIGCLVILPVILILDLFGFNVYLYVGFGVFGCFGCLSLCFVRSSVGGWAFFCVFVV